MQMITTHNGNLATEIARMGLPPLAVDNGSVELSLQQFTGKTRWVTRNYPADRIPTLGDEIELADENGTNKFIVAEIRHLLVPRAKETIRAVFLVVERVCHF